MTYSEKLKGILKQTLIGLGIGFIISLVFIAIFGGFKGNLIDILGYLIVCTIFFGMLASIVVASKSGNKVVAGKIAEKVGSTIAWAFAFSFGGSMFGIVLCLIKFLIGIAILIPICIYMASAYFTNLIYFIIMSVLEKLNIINSDSNITKITDTLVNILPIILTSILSIIIISQIKP